VRLGQTTVVVAIAWMEVMLPAPSIAAFEYSPQLEVEVALAMCNFVFVPDPRFPKLQFNAWPAIEHEPGPL
jgi:hypothetical protein